MSRINALCLGAAAAQAAAAAGFTISPTVNLSQPRSSLAVSSSSSPSATILLASSADALDHAHPDWQHECLIVVGSGRVDNPPGSHVRYVSAEELKDPAVVPRLLQEYAAAGQLRDSMRELKAAVAASAKPLRTTDDIVEMATGDKVQQPVPIRTIQLNNFIFPSGQTLLGATVVNSGTPADLEVHVLPVSSPANVLDEDPKPRVVRLIQPDRDDMTPAEQAAIWEQVDRLKDPAVLFIPHDCDDKQLGRFVALALRRKNTRRRAPAGGVSLHQALQGVQAASTALKVDAANLK